MRRPVGPAPMIKPCITIVPHLSLLLDRWSEIAVGEVKSNARTVYLYYSMCHAEHVIVWYTDAGSLLKPVVCECADDAVVEW